MATTEASVPAAPAGDGATRTSPPRRRRSRLAIVLSLGLLCVGSGLFLAGRSLPDGHPRLVPGDAPINAGASDRANIDANNSPSVVQNPRNRDNLAVANRVDSPLFACKFHVSLDAGATWTKVPIPFPLGEELPARCWAPDVTFGPDGRLYLSFVTLKGTGNVPNALWVATSSDGGLTLADAVRVTGPLAFQARLAADPRQPGRVYLVWLQAKETALLAFPETGNPIVMARSDDGGSTWDGPVRVSPSNRARVVAPSVVTGPRGELYVSYLDVGDDVLDYHGAHEGKGGPPYGGPWTLMVARSLDGGSTWTQAVVDSQVVPTQRFVVFFPPAPALAVDGGNGRLYLAFHDGRFNDADVLLWASGNGGATFTAPTRVNDTPRGDQTDQYLPKVAVAPGGRVDVVYYDRRADKQNLFNEVSLQSSRDSGRTFGDRIRISLRAFDSRVGWNEERNMAELGSRLGLVSDDRGALAVWADTRAGNRDSVKQDLGRAAVSFPDASPLRPAFMLAGGVLVVSGLVVAAAVVLRVSAAARRGPRTGKSSASLQPSPASIGHNRPASSDERS
jgi:hypothetical protein